MDGGFVILTAVTILVAVTMLPTRTPVLITRSVHRGTLVAVSGLGDILTHMIMSFAHFIAWPCARP